MENLGWWGKATDNPLELEVYIAGKINYRRGDVPLPCLITGG